MLGFYIYTSVKLAAWSSEQRNSPSFRAGLTVFHLIQQNCLDVKSRNTLVLCTSKNLLQKMVVCAGPALLQGTKGSYRVLA